MITEKKGCLGYKGTDRVVERPSDVVVHENIQPPVCSVVKHELADSCVHCVGYCLGAMHMSTTSYNMPVLFVVIHSKEAIVNVDGDLSCLQVDCCTHNALLERSLPLDFILFAWLELGWTKVKQGLV